MAASGPSITEIKLLFARSGNRRAFPKCHAPMAVNETLIGEVCHIRGARLGSARYDPGQTDLERHAYPNLVLMRPTDHPVIDDDEDAYTVERLARSRLNTRLNRLRFPMPRLPLSLRYSCSRSRISVKAAGCQPTP